jgi:peptide-methionine (S)-S-oxide reductase
MDRQTIILGGGCFWCIEAAYRRLDGVLAAESGYAGGSVAEPTYQAVCTGSTGHAEVVRITYDADVLPLEEVLDFFWRAHDPTTLNRQGADVGSQYRSVIICENEAQREAAERSRHAAQSRFSDAIVTEITGPVPFYPAEAYHADYYENNPNQGYCRMVIQPKLRKLGFDVAPLG